MWLNNNIVKAALRWFHEMRKENVPINGPMVSEKERKSASLLGGNNNLKTSNGGLTFFRERHAKYFFKNTADEKM